MSAPSHGCSAEPLRPAWPSWIPIFAVEFAWTNSTIRRHAAACSGAYIPAQPRVIRPSGETFVISVITSPAPPTAQAPRWTRCHSPGAPSTAEYWHIGDTTTRFCSSSPRRHKGVNIGGGAGSCLALPAFSANQRSSAPTYPPSRTRRFS